MICALSAITGLAPPGFAGSGPSSVAYTFPARPDAVREHGMTVEQYVGWLA